MNTIAIIGANGQVGTEVCLYLGLLPDVRVVPICRTHSGAAFLRRCGLECRIGTLENPESARALLEGCDLVADFSLPKGMSHEMRAATQTLISNAIACAATNARFVYISSTMAWGMPTQRPVYANYFFSHTTYSAMKRFGENLAFQQGRRHGHPVWALRLGHVHGEMQAFSLSLLRNLRDEPTFLQTTAYDVVFTFSIAEALRNIAHGDEDEAPGLYSLVPSPPWTWAEVHGHYARRIGISPRLHIEPDRQAPGALQNFKAFLKRNTVDCALDTARRHREWLTNYVLNHFPDWERRLKAVYALSNARHEIAALKARQQYRPFDASNPTLGAVPGRRLRSLSDSRVTMEAQAERVRELIHKARPESVQPSPQSERH